VRDLPRSGRGVVVTEPPLPTNLPSVAEGVSLVHGWVPVVVEVLAITAFVAGAARRPRGWYPRWVVWAVAAGLAVALMGNWLLTDLGVAGEPAPSVLWAWAGLTGSAAITIVLGWSGSHWFRRNLTVFATAVCLLCTGVVINGWIGYFPTVDVAWATLIDAPVPGSADWDAVRARQRTAPGAGSGSVLEVAIPATASGFAHRDELVYLPPAWFSSVPAPQLPVVMMIGAEFHTPADWVRMGGAVTALDAYAAGHDGYAPMAVFVDAGGEFFNDTECVNGPRGNAADHLVEDVIPFITTTFGASTGPGRWGLAGFSAGGTCALDLAVTHSDRFGAFLDVGGDPGPNAGTKSQTVDRLFGGDLAAWTAFDPETVMSRHGPYRDLTGVIMVPAAGVDDDAAADARSSCATAVRYSITCEVRTLPGRHDWPFAAEAWRATLPWLVDQLGGPAVIPQRSVGLRPRPCTRRRCHRRRSPREPLDEIAPPGLSSRRARRYGRRTRRGFDHHSRSMSCAPRSLGGDSAGTQRM
jgi:S-formylglutathione hydrolase FrmB